MGVVEGEEADRGRDTTRARAEKEEPGGRGIIRIGGMQGNGRERNRKGTPSTCPSTLPPRRSCARRTPARSRAGGGFAAKRT